MNQFIETYRGVKIYFDQNDGFFATSGCEQFGYADAVQDIRDEIDDYFVGPDDDRARQAIGW